MALEAAGLLVTDWCPARCRHCYVAAGPEGSRWMAPEAAAGHLAALARLGVGAAGVHVGGGEPFGDFERLLAIVRAARQVGLGGVGYVETSGSWAAREGLVRERLAALAEAGMRQLAISADPYHQEFVPPERVRLLHAVAAEVLGPGGVRARRWRWLADPQDVAAMSEAEREALFRATLARYPERMTGRAAARLAALVERRPASSFAAERSATQDASDLGGAGCRAALLESGHVHVDPEGWVYPGTCAGIALGRATAARPLDEVVRAWRARPPPLAVGLAERGPRALADLAAAHGWRPDEAGYAGKCHWCWSLRRHLVRAGAGGDLLGPPTIYLTAD